MQGPKPFAKRRRLDGPSLAILLALGVVGACSTSAAPAASAGAGANTAGGAAGPSRATGVGGVTSAGPSVPAASFAIGSACSLVSTTDLLSLASATSATVAVDSGAGTGDVVCGWQLTPVGAATVEILTGATAQREAPVWGLFQTKTAVAGVGDEAHWDGHTLLVKVGDGYGSFLVGGDSVKDLQAATTSLAKLVVPKLGATSVPSTVGATSEPSPTAAAGAGGTSAAAWCAFVIEINTKYGYMTDKNYSGTPSLDVQRQIVTEALSRVDEWITKTPSEIKDATAAEIAWFKRVKAYGDANGWTDAAAFPQPSATELALVSSLVPYQEQQCGITFGK